MYCCHHTRRFQTFKKPDSVHTHTILFSLGVQPVVHCFNNTVPVKKDKSQRIRNKKKVNWCTECKGYRSNSSWTSWILGQVYLGLNQQTVLAFQILKYQTRYPVSHKRVCAGVNLCVVCNHDIYLLAGKAAPWWEIGDAFLGQAAHDMRQLRHTFFPCFLNEL